MHISWILYGICIFYILFVYMLNFMCLILYGICLILYAIRLCYGSRQIFSKRHERAVSSYLYGYRFVSLYTHTNTHKHAHIHTYSHTHTHKFAFI